MIQSKHLLFIGLFALLAIGSCKEDLPPDPDPPNPVLVPETYSFDDVEFSTQTELINQIIEMSLYLKTANLDSVELDAGVLQHMFENTNGDGDGNFSVTSSPQLISNCFPEDQEMFAELFAAAELASSSTADGQSGQAGRVSPSGSDELRVFDENGFEYSEIIEKTLLGSVLYYQATSVLMLPERMDVDNEVIVEGQGTEMQHTWDQIYGLFGATVDYPVDTEFGKYWAKYSFDRDNEIGSVNAIGASLRKGRSAIASARYDIRDEAIGEVRVAWEQICAATALHHLNRAIAHIASDYIRNHELSIAYAMLTNLGYNTEMIITKGKIGEIKSRIGGNFYKSTEANLTIARDQLAETYGFEGYRTDF